MKIFHLALVAVAVSLGACSSEDGPRPAGGEVSDVSFSISLESGTLSRSFGDGKHALRLQYAVYESGRTIPVLTVKDGSTEQPEFSEGSLSADISLRLVNGKSYDIIFWADNADAPYTFNENDRAVTISYDGMAVNDETRDAFYGMTNTGVISGPVARPVTLSRPFAQVNLGTNDIDTEEAERIYGKACENLRTSLKTRAYTVLNLATGEVSGETDVIVSSGAVPAGEVFPVEGYTYLQMNYLLVHQSASSVADFSFGLHKGDAEAHHTIDVASVPLQRNYRTNIYGALLTNPVGITVTKDNVYHSPDNDIPYPSEP